MKIRHLLLCLLVLAISNNLSAAIFFTNAPENQYRKVIKLVSMHSDGGGSSTASAFPIDADTILTAGHFCGTVVKNHAAGKSAETIDALYLLPDNRTAILRDIVIKRFVEDEILDICILKKKKHGLKPINLSIRNYDFSYGEKVTVVGCPLGFFPPIITDGHMSTNFTENFSQTVLNGKILVSATSTFGNSGGAVFNKEGEVIGMSVMTHPSYKTLSFAISSIDIKHYLESNK